MEQSRSLFLRQDRARQMIDEIEDPVVRNLVILSVGQITKYLVIAQQNLPSDPPAERPEGPVDLAFFVSVMAKMFALKEIIHRIQQGETTAQATGWDF